MCAVIVTGCTSSVTPAKSDSPEVASTTIPMTPLQAPVKTPTFNDIRSIADARTTLAPTATVSLWNDTFIINYPTDWEMEKLSESSVRDYGRNTTNIANFYSPDVIPLSTRYNESQPNIDKTGYTTLSIDVDPEPVKDFEEYFNRVVLALGNYYGSITITKHNYQLNISVTDTDPGYKSYQLDFDTPSMRRTYIFTDVYGTIYISAFKNPSPYSAEVNNMYHSIKIIPLVSTQKHR